MNSRVKKLVSLLCTAAMLVSALPMSALAAEGEHDHGAEGCAYVNGAYVCNPDAALKGESATLQKAALFAAPRAAGMKECTFPKGKASDATNFTVSGGQAASAAALTVTVNGESKSFAEGDALKLNSDASIKFTAQAGDTLTVVISRKTRFKLNGADKSATGNVYTEKLTAGGDYTITKGKDGESYIHYVSFGSTCVHEVSSWTTTKEPTCVTAGTREGTCAKCGNKVTEPVAATGVHKWSTTEFETIKAPSCGVAGSKAAKCVNCTAVNSGAPEVIPALEHKYVGSYTICVNCGVDKITNEKHTAHAGEWHTVKDPTCLAEGEEARTCTACGAEEKQPIEKLEHDFSGAGGVCVNGCGMTQDQLKGDMTKQGGDLESAYIEWTISAGETRYEVFVKETSASSWTPLDPELVREYPGHMRADAMGLRAGTYQMKVVPYKGDAPQAELLSKNLEVKAQDRSGYAFVNGTTTPGAYTALGTLKSNAKVVYVTEKNKDTVTVEGVDAVGIIQIVQAAYKKKDNTTPPIDIRIIGNITDPSNVDLGKGDLYVDGGSHGKCAGLTIEGVGNDAVCNGFGIVLKGVSYTEVRNLGFMNCNSNEGDDLGLQQDNDHVWVHNCDFFYGDAGSDADQVKGDGALDTKKSTYVTHSYNHFWDNGKCNLQGMKDETTENRITYHHNWFDHSDSRHPRVRTCTVHVYNNYYDGNAKYGIGATMGSSIFAENNYFRNCNDPMLISNQGTDAKGDGTFSGENGGIIKAYGNIIVGAKNFVSQKEAPDDFDAYVVANRNDTVPATVKTKAGGTTYSNFDTASDFYRYTPDPAANVPVQVTRWAGRVEGGDFQWEFNNAVEDANYAVIPELKEALVNYKGSLLSVGGGVTQTVSGGSTPHVHTPGAWKVTKIAGCDPTTQALVDGTETRYCTTCGEVVETRKLAGHHSNDGQGKCTVCGATVANGGGPAVNENSKFLKAADFKDADTTKSITQADLDAKYEGYFKLVGANVKPGMSSSTKKVIDFLALPVDGSSGISFTVTRGPAEVTAKVSSTGKDKNSKFVLKDSMGNPVKDKKGADVIALSKNVSDATPVMYSLPADTYTLYAASGSANNVRLVELTVTEAEEAHEWGDWEITPATCGKDGLRKHTCSKCGKVETFVIDATGDHDWDDGVVLENGDTLYTCKVCHQTMTESGDEPTPPVVDKDELKTIITRANNALSGVKADTDAANVPEGTSWALQTDLDAFKTAIAKAQAVVDNTGATAADVSKATTELTAAIGKFADTLKDGTKPNGGDTPTPGNGKIFESKKESTFSGKAEKAEVQVGDGFTIICGTTTAIESTTEKTWSDGYTSAQRLKMGGKGTKGKQSIKFTTTEATNVKIWWVAGDADRQMAIFDDATLVEDATIKTSVNSVKDGAYCSTLNVPTAGTWYLGGTAANYVFKIEVTPTSGGDDPTPPTPVDKTALNADIKKAEEKLAATVESANGKDVESTKNWATKESKERFAAEIAVAKLAAKTAKTEAEVTAAINALKAASDAFVVRPGTKTDTPDNPGGNGGGGGGGGGSTTKTPAGQINGNVITIDSSTTAGHVAAVELTDAQAKTLTNNAVKSGSSEVVVSVNAPKSAAGACLNVSASALKDMSGKTDAALVLQTPVGDARLPHAAVAGLGSGKDISVTVARTNDGMKVTVTAGDKTLDEVPGGVTVVAGADGNGTVAYLRTADGEKLLKKSYVDGGKIYANLPGSGEIVLKDNGKTFRDIDDSWAKSAIDFAASRELFNGVNGLDFAPNQEMTRSMLVTVLYRLEGAKSSAANKFADVPADSWYTEAVVWANNQGIVSGKSETHFGPDDDITREQLATILYRYATKLCGMSEVSKNSKALEKFSDQATVSGFAADGMAWCVEQGIISGRGDGTLAPGGFASRAEVATMLMRFIKAIV